MEWRDVATVLSTRPQGESSVIAELFTAQHGRHFGLVRGGASRRMAAALQPGHAIEVEWRARLDGQLGQFRIEPLRSRAGALADRVALAGLSSVLALLRVALPERAPDPALFAASEPLLDVIGDRAPGWQLDYLRWEMGLLETLGYGLDLSRCALTGAREDLAYVSPRSGRAVSRQAAGDWAPRLLELPPCLLGQGPATLAEIEAGLRLTGHFLARHIELSPGQPGLPAARLRLLELIERS